MAALKTRLQDRSHSPRKIKPITIAKDNEVGGTDTYNDISIMKKGQRNLYS